MWTVAKIVSKGDYNYALVRGHPFATKNGYILEHRIVMENHLNRLLTTTEVVHHLNGNKKDNRFENLQLTTQEMHAQMHRLQEGKMYAEMKCPECQQLFIIPRNQTFYVKHTQYNCCSRSCNGKFSHKLKVVFTADIQQALAENLVREFKLVPVA